MVSSAGPWTCGKVSSGIEVILAVVLVFLNDHFAAQGINAWICRDMVFIVFSCEGAKEQTNCHHVLQTVITVRRIRQGASLINDADCRLMRRKHDFFNLIQTRCNLLVEYHCTFNCALSMDLSRKGDFEDGAAAFPYLKVGVRRSP